MPVQFTYPGVYVEELSSGSHTIIGVPTAVTAFVGRAPQGPVDEATVITAFADFEQMFGEVDFNYPLTYAVRDFFQNGGSEAYIVRRFKPIGKEDTTEQQAPTHLSGNGENSNSSSANETNHQGGQ